MPKPKSMSQVVSVEPNGDLELDPIIVGLLEKLPLAGEAWEKQDRAKWLQLFGLSLDMIYKDKEPVPHA